MFLKGEISMKETFETAVLEVISFEVEEVIATSIDENETHERD